MIEFSSLLQREQFVSSLSSFLLLVAQRIIKQVLFLVCLTIKEGKEKKNKRDLNSDKTTTHNLIRFHTKFFWIIQQHICCEILSITLHNI